MNCRLHGAEIDHKDLLEHILEHQLNLEEFVMGDLTKLTTDVTALIAENATLTAQNAQLKADADANAANDQAAIDALDAQVAAALPAPAPAPVTDPGAPVDGSAPVDDGSTPIADSIPTS